MRVIAGEARGRTLQAPRSAKTRPTSDLLRGVIFSMLASMRIQPVRVLDLYAGSGALGIEALSRGAVHADFVEQDPAACAVIRMNLAQLGFSDRAHVVCASVARSLRRLSGTYDLVLVDPPYADRYVEQALAGPDPALLLGEETVLVYEHSRRDSPPERLGHLQLFRTRSHGTSSVSFYARVAAEIRRED